MRHRIDYIGHSGEELGRDFVDGDLQDAIKHAEQKVANSHRAMPSDHLGIAEYVISRDGKEVRRHSVAGRPHA